MLVVEIAKLRSSVISERIVVQKRGCPFESRYVVSDLKTIGLGWEDATILFVAENVGEISIIEILYIGRSTDDFRLDEIKEKLTKYDNINFGVSLL